jgi:cytochrome P450
VETMMSDAILLEPLIPEHVPLELVKAFTWETIPGVEDHAIQAAAELGRVLPDIFYAPASRVGMNSWIISSDALIREVFQDGATFSTRDNAGFSQLLGENWPLLPLEVDGTEHLKWRKLLNPVFSPTRMTALEAQIDLLAIDLLEGLKDKGGCDFMSEFAAVYPIQIFLSMFGLPLDDTAKLLNWEHMLLHSGTHEGMVGGASAIVGYLRNIIATRTDKPADDLISYIATAKLDGRPLTADEKIGVCLLLYVAGLDTVMNMLGYMFRFLAENPAKQQALREDRGLIPAALEEMLRAFPIVVSSRRVTHDIEFHGVAMKKGDIITLGTPFSGRDPRAFTDPDTIDFNREKVDHITFSAGPHRCIGSHLARRELKIAIEAWLTRIPPFRIAEGQRATTRMVNGQATMETLPLAW